MTLKQWMVHFRLWLGMFPKFSGNGHSWTRPMGEREMTCCGCGATKMDTETSDERMARDRELDAEWSKLADTFSIGK